MESNIQLPSLEEQKEIANILESLDDQINVMAKSLEDLKTLKEKLLPRLMFPKVNKE